MAITTTCHLPGVYQYTYSTFVDAPQLLCIHFITPDGQQAFVSYPRHPRRKAAQLIPMRWLESVELTKLDEQPQLMRFIEFLVSGLVGRTWSVNALSNGRDNYVADEPLAAY